MTWPRRIEPAVPPQPLRPSWSGESPPRSSRPKKAPSRRQAVDQVLQVRHLHRECPCHPPTRSLPSPVLGSPSPCKTPPWSDVSASSKSLYVIGQGTVPFDPRRPVVTVNDAKPFRLLDVEGHPMLAGHEVDGAELAAESAGMENAGNIMFGIAGPVDDNLARTIWISLRRMQSLEPPIGSSPTRSALPKAPPAAQGPSRSRR